MTARHRLERTRLQLAVAATLGAVLWGVAVTVLGMAASAVFDMLRPGAGPGAAEPAALILGIVVAGVMLARLRPLRSEEQVALWIEDRQPALRYALVTLSEGPRAPQHVDAALESAVAGVTWTSAVRNAVSRAVGIPAAAIFAAGVLFALAVSPAGAAFVAHAAVEAGAGPAMRSPSPALSGIVARVTPPAYAGLRPFTVADPSAITALEGSTVALDGPGPAAVRATMEGRVLAASVGDRWRLALVMPESALAVRLAGGGAERVLLLEPVPDSAPVVTLTAPVRDTVLRAPAGRVSLAAEVRDDLGLAGSWFELIISSGERETYTFRTAALARTGHDGARTASRRLVLPLDSLRLQAGDVLSLRVVAQDRNPAAGRGLGVSETRTIRIARPGEYDSLALEGLPPIMSDTAALSQRMLIMLTEALQRRRPRLARDTVIAEARRIARDQGALRRRVADIIFMRLGDEASGEEVEGDEPGARDTPEAVMAAAEAAANRDASAALDFDAAETPVVAVNRPLLEAYNAMWDATRELEIGEPDDALPPMRAALAAIQRARQAERLYLRGRPPVVVVDLARVRLAGDRAGAASARRLPGAALNGARARLAGRFAAALDRLGRDDVSGVDSLLLLRLDALRTEPRFAAALGRAVDDLRAGRDATGSLIAARGALGGHTAEAGPLPVWAGAW